MSLLIVIGVGMISAGNSNSGLMGKFEKRSWVKQEGLRGVFPVTKNKTMFCLSTKERKQ
ncbi:MULTISPECIES: hypothetical protein [Pseudomonas]|uniref:hypothetical protein n=1 Tax=Pseudomonas TaxID=286 RepID=UPI001314215A|nr:MULTISPECIES: hypothetical protein [Pseudomonas]MDW3711570.1 hypothetical protein [Pseudomonas sp. 2023EL-01195]